MVRHRCFRERPPCTGLKNRKQVFFIKYNTSHYGQYESLLSAWKWAGCHGVIKKSSDFGQMIHKIGE